MTTVGTPGTGPQFNTVQETGATAGIGRKPVAAAPGPEQARLAPRDQISQTAGVTGKAAPVDLVGSTPQANQIRDLLVRKDFDAITQLVNQLGERGLGKLDLSLDEIKAIAEGMGQGSWNAGLPVFASFSGEDRQAVQTLLQHSLMNINQKVGSLNQLVGPEAVLSLLRSSETSELSGLSLPHRHMMLAMLDPGNSIWGSIQGAGSEIARRTIGGDTQADALKSKLLLSTNSESQARELLNTLSQFNRDDVIFQYVKDMPAEKMAKLSEGFKTYLLKELVDSKINVAGFELDLNKIANVDEMVKMVSGEHAEVARGLYLALKPETRQSAEVRAIVSSSEVMMKQLQELETEIKADADSGKLSADKLKGYRDRLTSYKAQTAQDPALQQKTAALESLLNQLQQGLTQADQTRQLGLSTVTAATAALKTVQDQANALKSQVSTLSTGVNALDQRVERTETELKSKLAQLATLGQSAGALSEEYSALLAQLEPLMNDGKPLPGKLPQLDQLLTKLQQAETRLTGLSPELDGIKTQLGALRGQIQQQRQEYTQSVSQFNQQRLTLENKTSRLQDLLKGYQQQISALAGQHSEATNKLKGFTELPAAQRQSVQAELDAAAATIQGHRSSYNALNQTLTDNLVPGAREVAAVETAMAPSRAALETAFARVETRVDASEAMVETAEATVQEIESVLDRTKRAATELAARLGSTVGDMGINELNRAKTEITNMAKALRAQTGGGSAGIEAELKQLQDVLTMIDKTKIEINQARDIAKRLGSALTDAKGSTASTDEVLNAALRHVQDASAAVEDARKSVDSVEGELALLGDEVKAYESDIQAFTDALNALDTGNETSKSDFKKILPTDNGPRPGGIQSIQSESEKMLKTFADNEAKRTDLRSKIVELRAKIETKQGEMLKQRSQLETAHKSLETKIGVLKDSEQKLQPLVASLERVNAITAKTIQDNEELIAQWSGKNPTNKAVVAALKTAREQNVLLVNQLKVSEPLVTRSQAELSKLAGQINDAETARTQVGEQIGDVNTTLSDKLNGALIHLDRTEGEIRTLDDRKRELKTQLETLLGQVESGGVSGDLVFGQLRTFLDRSKDYETMSLINMIGSRVGQARGAVRQADQTLSLANQAVTAARANLAGKEAEVTRITDQITALSNETGQMEAEVSEAQNGLLSVQNDLLAQRRQMGIAHPQYQALLQRYGEILESGRPMTSGEVDELRGLEGQLSGIESGLAQSSHALSAQITSMNMLKSRINKGIDELGQKTRRLEELRADLVNTQGQLTQARQGVAAARTDLVTRRDELVRLRDELKSRPNIQGLAEVQTMLAQLDSSINELNGAIGRADGSLEGIDQTLGQTTRLIASIDAGLEAAQNLKGRLELIQGKLADLLTEAGNLQRELGDLLAMIGKLKFEIEEIKKQVANAGETPENVAPSETGTRAQPTRGQTASAAGTEQLGEQRTELRRQSFSQRLSDQMTNLWGQRQRQSESRRDQDHQVRRQALLQDLEHRSELARQYQTELSAQIVEQQGLEEITAHKVQMALLGQDVSSSLNVV